MEPEITAPEGNGNKKKYLIITLVVILLAVGALLVYLFMQKDTPGQQTVDVPTPVVQEKKIYTQAEKEDMIAKVTVASSSSEKEQIKKILILNKTPIEQSAIISSDEEKINILNAVHVK